MASDKININIPFNHADRSERKAKTVVACIAILLGVVAVVVCVNAIPEWLASLIKMMG